MRSCFVPMALLALACAEPPAPAPASNPAPAAAPAVDAEPFVPAASGPRADVSGLRIEPAADEPAVRLVVSGGLRALPEREGDWEVEVSVHCQFADRSDGRAGLRWGSLVPVTDDDPLAFTTAQILHARELDWCEIDYLYRRACSPEDARRNACSEQDALALPRQCFVPAADAWEHVPVEACRPFWRVD